MTDKQVMNLLRVLIDDSKTALLITATGESPDARWMTPTLLDAYPNYIFCLTSAGFMKARQLDDHPESTWMFQSRLLDKIAKIKGTTTVIRDASLLQEVLDKVMNRLSVFWKVNKDETSLVVLETKIEKADVFYPLKGERYLLSFKEENNG